jgi:hypothetical protein
MGPRLSSADRSWWEETIASLVAFTVAATFLHPLDLLIAFLDHQHELYGTRGAVKRRISLALPSVLDFDRKSYMYRICAPLRPPKPQKVMVSYACLDDPPLKPIYL